jgi:hypothetical protein
MLYANKNLRLVVAALGLLAAPLSAPAQAAVIFQSALYSGVDTNPRLSMTVFASVTTTLALTLKGA